MAADPSTATDTLLAFLTDPAITIVARLAQNTINPESESLQLSDFTQCDFPGYAPVTNFDWDATTLDDAEQGEALSAVISFTAGAIVTPQPITAFYVEITYPGQEPVLLQAEVFDTPEAVEAEGDTFTRQVRINSLPD